MLGLMQERPLLISGLLQHAASHHSAREIVTRVSPSDTHRTTWGEVATRSRRLALSLEHLQVGHGHVVGTIATNTYRHLELYFGVSGIGAVLHTINPRFSLEQLRYVVPHAEDAVLFVDEAYLPLVEQLLAEATTVRAVVVLDSVPQTDRIGGRPLLSYEGLLVESAGDTPWPTFDERTASTLCYTSGTTGRPKGVLCSHRSTVLHTWAQCLPDGYGISARSTILALVPLYHANAWGLPYAAAMTGAKLVLPGSQLDAGSVYELMQAERVTLAAGVPTLWQGLLDHVAATNGNPRDELCLERIICGGSALSRALFEAFRRVFGVRLQQGWGMTELNPCGVFNTPLADTAPAGSDAETEISLMQGRAAFGVELRLVDDEDRPVPHDASRAGHLRVRGPWVTRAYYKEGDRVATDVDGFFATGDIATIRPDGYLRLVDRAKDLVKSGGEWISSLELEQAALSCNGIMQAAVIGIPDVKWQERPMLLCVLEPGATVDADTLRTHLKARVASWWVPEKVLFVDSLPVTSTGKIAKAMLRERYARTS